MPWRRESTRDDRPRQSVFVNGPPSYYPEPNGYPGSGESDMPPGPYSTQTYADQLSGFLGSIGIERAHVAGVSLGAAVAMHLAARHPERVRSLSLHSAWDRTDAYLRTIVELRRSLAGALPTVADAVIQGIFPLCFTPEMYVERPEYAQALAYFVRGRPAAGSSTAN